MKDTPNFLTKHVGILAMEVYTPSTFVSQLKLESYYGVDAGKYTLGLGQDGIAVCGDCEDVNSLALTVVQRLLEKYDIHPSEVGRLEVGTESLVDKSKSTKTVLMDLFEDNSDIEGATVINACYGGTAALFNAFNWVESDGWDGRFAIVVAADIAAYASGNARPTSGAGAVACLVGRDAPLAFSDPRLKATHASNVWDFFKPDHNVEYPTVNGALSQLCYYKALEDCYCRFADKMDKFHLNGSKSDPLVSDGGSVSANFNADSVDYFAFHAPYNKLVQKSYARLFLLDAKRSLNHKLVEKCQFTNGYHQHLDAWISLPLDQTYLDRGLENALKNVSSSSYQKRLTDSNYASKKIGNTYTASVFMGLASLIDRVGSRGDLVSGKTVCVFSYGSGAIASMYLLQVRDPHQSRFSIQSMVSALDLTRRLDSREEIQPQELDLALDTRASMHRLGAPYTPCYPTVGRLFPGTFFLKNIAADWTRTYERVPLMVESESVRGGPLGPILNLSQANSLSVTTPKLDSNAHPAHSSSTVSCVITGVSAGLPTGEGPVFHPDNLSRLMNGEQFIKPIKESIKMALLEKNVIQISKAKDGSVQQIAVNTESTIIKLAAQLGSLDLTLNYGVLAGIAETMDVAAQVAVAAGFEALKEAGLVTGKSNDPSEWMLPEELRERTGIVYASSFPAMDAAIGEVMKFLQSKTINATNTHTLVTSLRRRLENLNGCLMKEDVEALDKIESLAETAHERVLDENKDEYLFDRKFLFRVLVLANAQLAQLTGCRGPNTQTNAACAGTTQAIAMAQDMIVSGRADRVVVIAGDNASGDTLLPWLGSGFRVLGAACTASAVEDAALPFDKRRCGMLLGAGGIGMVLESEDSYKSRCVMCQSLNMKARLLATQYSNSAFHGASLDRKHIASELKRFLIEIEAKYGINKSDIATNGVYLSHETSTNASPAQSCAGNEITALREVFGAELLSRLLILNTKGFTGHPMGVSFEDIVAVEALWRQHVPPVVNHDVKDEYLGDIKLSKGGPYSCRYALRFAAGFGSQVAFALYTVV